VLNNAAITTWQHVTSSDGMSGPVRSVQDGGPWPVYIEPYIRTTMDFGGRERRSSHRATGRSLPAILGAQDLVTILGRQFEVLAAEPVGVGAIAHVQLMLAAVK
jgi:hypothetical protein